MERQQQGSGFRMAMLCVIAVGLCAVAGWAQPPARVEVLRITLTPRGFEPASVSVAPGRILLAVDNRTGLPEVTLRLAGGAGPLRERRFPRGRVKWREFYTLSVGDYLLSELNHPQWVCRIRVAPR